MNIPYTLKSYYYIILNQIREFFTLKANKSQWYHYCVTGQIYKLPTLNYYHFLVTYYIDGELTSRHLDSVNVNSNDITVTAWFRNNETKI